MGRDLSLFCGFYYFKAKDLLFIYVDGMSGDGVKKLSFSWVS